MKQPALAKHFEAHIAESRKRGGIAGNAAAAAMRRLAVTVALEMYGPMARHSDAIDWLMAAGVDDARARYMLALREMRTYAETGVRP